MGKQYATELSQSRRDRRAVGLWMTICLLWIGGFGEGLLADDRPEPLGGYASFVEMEARLQALAQSPLATVESLGETLGQRTIWLLTVAEAPEQSKPAILILGNVSAAHLLGRELALRMAERVVTDSPSNPALAALLQNYTLYFIPSPTPDATEKNFGSPVREHSGNLTPTDDDRDFEVGEDPPRDLNQDGWITVMRVADDFGTHVPHPRDSRVLIPIDASRREVGRYRIMPESRDSDGDESFGEDGSDGVDFNRNFTFNYSYFGKSAGPHQVSERESRAVADFMFDHPNIAFVFCFSPEDNLFHPWKGSPQTDAARIKTSVLTEDQSSLECLAEAYRKLHGSKSAPKPPSGEGSFSEWAYFHYGRWSLAARGWWIPELPPSDEQPAQEAAPPDAPPHDPEAAPQDASAVPAEESDAESEPVAASPTEAASPTSAEADSATTDPATADAASQEAAACQPSPTWDKKDQRGAEDLAALAWFESQGIAGFVDWQPYEHPDLPGKQVEIGGFKPLYRLNPPESLIGPLVQPHVDFLLELERNWPRLEIRDLEAKRLAAGLYDVRCRLVNTGPLPTMPQIGSVSRQWYPIQVTLQGSEEARWIEGSRRQSVGRLEARGGATELRWVFMLPEPPADGASLRIDAQAPTLHPVEVVVPVSEP